MNFDLFCALFEELNNTGERQRREWCRGFPFGKEVTSMVKVTGISIVIHELLDGGIGIESRSKRQSGSVKFRR